MEKAEGLYYTENTQSNTEALAHYSVELKFQNMTSIPDKVFGEFQSLIIMHVFGRVSNNKIQTSLLGDPTNGIQVV